MNSNEVELCKAEINCYNLAISSQRYLSISYETVDEYLYLLETIAVTLSSIFEARLCFYLAAAVSDFYIPYEKVTTS